MNAILQLATRLSLGGSRYHASFASCRAEVEEALRLRFNVFNLELNEGLEDSYISGLDEDRFDAVCDHLLVRDAVTGEVVGTYRMQTGERAKGCLGYYSEQEFEFAPFECVRNAVLELGRACVHEKHRSISVIGLLWKGVIRYASERSCRYLVGCSSLTSQDASLGWAMYERLALDSLCEAGLQTIPREGFALPPAMPLAMCPPPPRLLRAYLAVGARIAGPPAIDRSFKTIDFLTILDVTAGTRAAVDRFLTRPAAEQPTC